MTRALPAIGNSIEWNLVGRRTLQAPTIGTPENPQFGIIPVQSFLIENGSYTVAIGINAPTAPSSWYTGGFASQNLPVTVSSTTEFVPLLRAREATRLQLGILNLCVFEKLLTPWVLRIAFPKWLTSVGLEVWRYDGPDTDLVTSKQVLTTTVAASNTPVLLLAERTNRKGAVIVNNSTAPLAITLGLVADPETPLVLSVGGYYETPFGYTGAIVGVWSTSFSDCTVQEFL